MISKMFIIRNLIAMVALYFAYFETGPATVIILLIITSGLEVVAFGIRRTVRILMQIDSDLAKSNSDLVESMSSSYEERVNRFTGTPPKSD